MLSSLERVSLQVCDCPTPYSLNATRQLILHVLVVALLSYYLHSPEYKVSTLWLMVGGAGAALHQRGRSHDELGATQDRGRLGIDVSHNSGGYRERLAGFPHH